MFRIALAAALVASVSAFAPARRGHMSMEVNLVGASKPLGFFDPLGFSKNEGALMNYREAELKHCRMAMLAALGYFVQCVYHPLYEGASMSNNPFIAMKSVPMLGWVQIVAAASIIEVVGILAKKRPDYQPGDLLGSSEWVDNSDEGWVDYQTKELNNGRLAMLAMAGLFAQSAVGAPSGDILFTRFL